VPYTDGGTQRFARIMGTGNALYMLMTGVRFDARRAWEMGFLQEVVPAGQALPRALELADAIAAYPNFAGICADRRAVLQGQSLDLDEGLLLEAEIVRPACFSDELREGLARFAGGARDASPRPPTGSRERGESR
jgi:enoyl-CoA hydratase